MLLARNDWLPEDKICYLGQVNRSTGRKQTARTQPPQSERRLATHSEFMVGSQHIVPPGCPGGITKIAGTIATPEQVDLQDIVARLRQCASLNCNHAPGFVHLLGKGVEIQYRPFRLMRLGFVKNTEAKAVADRKKVWCQSFGVSAEFSF